MKKTFLIAILALTACMFAFEPHFMYDPAISPDGKKVCFVYQNDLWLVNFDGGEAKRLTATEFSEFGPVFSPDGKYIAYAANRNHTYQVWYMPASGGKAQLFNPENATPYAFFSNSKSILSGHYQPGEGSAFVKINKNKKRFEFITEMGESLSDISPDDKKIVFARKGNAHREKYEGSTNGDLWEYNIKTNEYKRLTNTPKTERYPVYSHTVKNRIYFGASDGKVFQLYYADNYDFKNRKQLTNFDTWSVRDISIAEDNDKMVFECFDNLYTYNPENNKVEKINIDIKQDFIKNYDVRETVNSKAKFFALSDDASWIAFSYKYDLFAVPTKGGEVKQITFDAQGIDDITILPDNRTVFFSKFNKGYRNLYRFNIENPEKIKKISWFDDKDVIYHYVSNDSVFYVNYRDGEKANRLAKVSKSGSVTKLIDDKVYGFTANKDKTYAVYQTYHPETYAVSVHLYDFKTKKAKIIYQTDKRAANFNWADDGKSIYFTAIDGIAKFDLKGTADFENEKDNWKEVLAGKSKKEDKKKKDKKTEKFVPKNLKDIDVRTSMIINKKGWNWIISLTDKELYFVNTIGSNRTIYKHTFEKDKTEKVTSLTGVKNLNYNPDNKKLSYLQRGNIYTASISGSGKKEVEFEFVYEYNEQKLKQTVFEQVWGYFGKGFYDKNMHDVDWDDVFEQFKPYTKHAYNNDILEAIVDEMIGDVNASHTGFYPKSERSYTHYSQAYTGLVFDFREDLSKGFKIKKVFRSSPLAQVYNIKPGDVLLEVDGKKINKNTIYSKLFLNKTGKKIKLKFKTNGKELNAEIKGVGYSTINNWRYDNWVNERAQKVEELSKGKIGYLHIRGMNQTSLKKFKRDLWAVNYDKKALIIDVRGNGGGNISEELIEELTKVKMATTTRRGSGDIIKNYPANVEAMPKVVLINEDSFSDAEIFPYLFRTRELGKIIGMPTSGGVIGTSPRTLIDGSTMRMPGSGWFRLGGRNMELDGCKPDIRVEMTPKQIIEDDDTQLKTAVNELLKAIK